MDDRLRINKALKSAGLSGLGEPGLLAQLGYLVEGHEHFRQMLVKCEPQHRTQMYDQLKPNLRFEPRPLDVYMAEAGMDAEARQLPVWDDKAQRLVPYQAACISGVQEAVDQEFAKHRLVVTCRSCTKEEVFTGDTKADAVFNLRLTGWVYFEKDGAAPVEICPDCPAVRRKTIEQAN